VEEYLGSFMFLSEDWEDEEAVLWV
jgi:hypothetical protein